ncbi:unnamed protein product [Lepeophtheirus salmonis]|uniref:(salmon louse) hypothetical protein n=1 Tax=Lepeophtheirus salmonis TaxID=72036 RepID=A0A7R8CVM3_LEPSM|nr:unnamed protein product [Lepeophtheirus salmonis]CAF2912108.1 unnamed protein product [Lepeophtheirus salmonis]
MGMRNKIGEKVRQIQYIKREGKPALNVVPQAYSESIPLNKGKKADIHALLLFCTFRDGFNVVPGIQKDCFRILQEMSFHFENEEDFFGALSFDEVDIKNRFVIETQTQTMYGDCKKVQAAMLQARNTKERQFEIIDEIEVCGIKIFAVIFDLGNKTFLSQLGILQPDQFTFLTPHGDHAQPGPVEALHRFRSIILGQHHNQWIQNLSVEMENFEKETLNLFDSVYAPSEMIREFVLPRHQSNAKQQLNRPTPPGIRRSSNKGLTSLLQPLINRRKIST